MSAQPPKSNAYLLIPDEPPVAEDELCRVWGPYLRTLARRFGNGRGHTEDLMQEGFIGLLKGHRSYPGRGSYKAWCVSCVKSAMSDYRGYDVGRVAIEDLLEHHLIDGNTEQEIFSGLGFEGLLRRVRNKKGREYLRLYYNHGYTFREIGERFGVSKQAVNGVARKEIKAIKRKTILTIR